MKNRGRRRRPARRAGRRRRPTGRPGRATVRKREKNAWRSSSSRVSAPSGSWAATRIERPRPSRRDARPRRGRGCGWPARRAARPSRTSRPGAEAVSTPRRSASAVWTVRTVRRVEELDARPRRAGRREPRADGLGMGEAGGGRREVSAVRGDLRRGGRTRTRGWGRGREAAWARSGSGILAARWATGARPLTTSGRPTIIDNTWTGNVAGNAAASNRRAGGSGGGARDGTASRSGGGASSRPAPTWRSARRARASPGRSARGPALRKASISGRASRRSRGGRAGP